MTNERADSSRDSELTIVSWNINGIRAAKSPLKSIFDSLDADVICLQETKTTRDLMDETLANVDGYSSYFSFSRRRSGYSGVATYCRYRATPVAAEEGLTGVATNFIKGGIGCYETGDFDQEALQAIDAEGRAMLTKHSIRLDDGDERQLTVINVYCPCAYPDNPERLEFKLQFYELLRLRAEAILNSGCHVVIVGDINTSHKPIDHCDPGDEEEYSSVQSRVFLDRFIANNPENKDSDGNGGKFVDTFRHFHPDERNAFTCWRTTTGARQTNYGTRLDYIFVDERLVARSVVKCSDILPHVTGSDHCPVKSVFLCMPLPSSKCPSSCTKYWPEFAGKQTKLLNFFDLANSKMCSESTSSTAVVAMVNDGGKRKAKVKQKDLNDFFKSNTKKTRLDPSAPADTKVEMQPPKVLHSGNLIDAWKAIFKGQKQPPLCVGHGEPCVLRTVKKPGPNYRRDFYVCARPEGHTSNPESSCDFFKWATKVRTVVSTNEK